MKAGRASAGLGDPGGRAAVGDFAGALGAVVLGAALAQDLSLGEGALFAGVRVPPAAALLALDDA